jgi:hypothetical protein
MGRDNMASQERRSRIAKLTKELEQLQEQEKAEASRPGPKQKDVKDGEFVATVYSPPTADSIFREEDDPVASAINSRRPLNPTRKANADGRAGPAGDCGRTPAREHSR